MTKVVYGVDIFLKAQRKEGTGTNPVEVQETFLEVLEKYFLE